MNSNPNCPHCNGSSVKNGFYTCRRRGKTQRYRCKQCNTEFSDATFDQFYRHNHPKDTVLWAVARIIEWGVSTRQAAEKISVSHQTCWRWSRQHQHTEPETDVFPQSRVWHVDEKWIRVSGDWNYLFIVENTNRQILSAYVAEEKSLESTCHVLRLALRHCKGPPDVVVTDRMPAYPAAIRLEVRGAKHVTAHFEPEQVVVGRQVYEVSNNLVERLNGTFQRYYHGMRGFKDRDSAQAFVDTWTNWYNHERKHMTLGTVPAAAR